MSIDKELLDRLMEGRSPGDRFGKEGILSAVNNAKLVVIPGFASGFESSPLPGS